MLFLFSVTTLLLKRAKSEAARSVQGQAQSWNSSGGFSGGSEKPGKLEVGGASRDSTGLGALEEGLISS